MSLGWVGAMMSWFWLARPARYADGEHMPLASGFAAAGRVFMRLWVKLGGIPMYCNVIQV
jgi:hypothetical protein